MSAPLWAIEAAECFWEMAGDAEPFPRDLRRPIAMALPLAVVSLPRLRVSGIDDWLRREGIDWGMWVADRPLRACLVARRDQGLLFVDGTDLRDEARFSLAHELAHYLRHYQQPRRETVERLGLEILQVLDGERPPRHDERAHALLAQMQLGFHIHLMDRGDACEMDGRVSRAEAEADRLAYELLAPAGVVLPEMARFPAETRRDKAAFLLRTAYGLPNVPARRYAACLAPRPRQPDSFLQRLRATP